MYKKDQFRQMGLADFEQPIGLKMNPDNRWIKRAAAIPWDEIEERYAELFPSGTGHPAKPLRMAQGSLIIQKQYGFSDRELVDQITENPYYQYFIGLPRFQPWQQWHADIGCHLCPAADCLSAGHQPAEWGKGKSRRDD